MCANLFLITAMVLNCATAHADDAGRIQPYPENPYYWQYQGRPVLLLGGSDTDKLFQWTGRALTDHLDLLTACGGNYIRNSLSSRDATDAFPFEKVKDRYDLDRWNEDYWQRLDNLLAETHRRGIFVQIELFNMHDLSVAELWDANPWNPAGNINYTHENTRLPRRPAHTDYHNGESVGEPHGFFLSIPAVNADGILLDYQRRFVNRVLDHTFRFDHVLYCISNEIHTEYPPQWGHYWAQHLRQRAAKAGKQIEITEMHWAPEMTHRSQRAAAARPEVFTYFEASQNSANSGQKNWDQLHFIYTQLGDRPRPINHTKIYGADTGPNWAGSDREAEERFWRSIIGGSASSRFHRPPYGLGLGPKAQHHIRNMRMLTGGMNLFTCQPRNDLLTDRAPNEAYCLAEPGRQYAVYFPAGGTVTLDVRVASGLLELRWLDIGRGEWHQAQAVDAGRKLELKTPGNGHWAALVTSK